MAQVVEHILGKDEVGSSSLPNSSKKASVVRCLLFYLLLIVTTDNGIIRARGDNAVEIKASCKYERDAFDALIHVCIYKGAKPTAAFLFRILLASGVFVGLIALFIDSEYFDRVILIAAMSYLFIIFTNVYSHFIAPIIQYNSRSDLRGAKNDIVFYDDKLKDNLISEGCVG